MARKAPPISVKDLTGALAIGKQQGKEESLVAERSSPYIPFNRENNPSAYGDDTIEDEPGTDPAEMIQLELPLDLVNKLKIMADENPEIAQSIIDGLKISSENEDDYAPGSKKHPQTPGKPWQVANAGDQLIQGLPRGGRYGNSHRPARESGELTNDKLIETLRIAGPLLKGV